MILMATGTSESMRLIWQLPYTYYPWNGKTFRKPASTRHDSMARLALYEASQSRVEIIVPPSHGCEQFRDTDHPCIPLIACDCLHHNSEVYCLMLTGSSYHSPNALKSQRDS